MEDILKIELETYANGLLDLLDKHEGEYVLIKGDQIAGVYVSERDALREGYKLFGKGPFLVKQIKRIEEPARFTSALIRF
jgi:hypothetical protein